MEHDKSMLDLPVDINHIPWSKVSLSLDSVKEGINRPDMDAFIESLMGEAMAEMIDKYHLDDEGGQRVGFNAQIVIGQLMMLSEFLGFAQRFYHQMVLTEIAAHESHKDFFADNEGHPGVDDWAGSEAVISNLVDDHRRGFHNTMVGNLLQMFTSTLHFTNAHEYVPEEALVTSVATEAITQMMQNVRAHIIAQETMTAFTDEDIDKLLDAIISKEEESDTDE